MKKKPSTKCLSNERFQSLAIWMGIKSRKTSLTIKPYPTWKNIPTSCFYFSRFPVWVLCIWDWFCYVMMLTLYRNTLLYSYDSRLSHPIHSLHQKCNKVSITWEINENHHKTRICFHHQPLVMSGENIFCSHPNVLFSYEHSKIHMRQMWTAKWLHSVDFQCCRKVF